MDIFLNQLIQFYSNNATDLHHLTMHSMTVLTYKMAIILRPQICDVISPYLYYYYYLCFYNRLPGEPRLASCSLFSSPIILEESLWGKWQRFFIGQLSFLVPSQQCQSTDGNIHTDILYNAEGHRLCMKWPPRALTHAWRWACHCLLAGSPNSSHFKNLETTHYIYWQWCREKCFGAAPYKTCCRHLLNFLWEGIVN